MPTVVESTENRGPAGSGSPLSPSSPSSPLSGRDRGSTNTSSRSTSSRLRSASLKLLEADPPPGMWAATANVTCKAPTLGEIRKGAFTTEGWNEEAQARAEKMRRERKSSTGDEDAPERGWRRRLSRTGSGSSGVGGLRGINSSMMGTEPFPKLEEEEADSTPMKSETYGKPWDENAGEAFQEASGAPPKPLEENELPVYSNGYVPPPKLPWATSTAIGLRAFWHWFLTIPGFLITLYGLNIVAWGGMLFLLLVGAAPAMCHPSCEDINSPRRIWLEIDSQILNALFCVTGFGLIPWRFRDLYWLLMWRTGLYGKSGGHGEDAKNAAKIKGMRRLAGIHRNWFRLPFSDTLDTPSANPYIGLPPEENPAIPLPVSKRPDPPPTGIRAPPTAKWKMDFVVWNNVWNTFLQGALCGVMWGMNRYNRPSWTTGFLIAIASIVAGAAGIMMYIEGKNVKRVEGVPMAPQSQK
ncbi:hypothetical protein M501DRAFT_1009612 [Patellaria atrata CBS 101060]|uniref:Uncharacterized protein n=1 Tax=Patellaria atrata CBS 101060 TaxID=1346257 RepID=A0A9P4S2Y3_9PEZI|nr:hypothetical protein M501DRAFT_1009612 [Patellaria atrata CBS 101060]